MMGSASAPRTVAHVRKAVLDEMADELVDGAVVGQTALVARGDEAHPPQHRELVAVADSDRPSAPDRSR